MHGIIVDLVPLRLRQISREEGAKFEGQVINARL